MTKIFLLKRNWIWLSTCRDAQQVPRGEMPVSMLSCPSSKTEGKGVKLFKEKPTVILPHRVYLFFPVLPKFLQKKPQRKMNKDERHKLSPQCSECSRGTWHCTGSDIQKGSNEKPRTAICHLSSSYLISPSTPKRVTGRTVIMKPPRDWGFLYILHKTTQNPQLCQRLWMCDNVTRFFSSQSQPNKIKAQKSPVGHEK